MELQNWYFILTLSCIIATGNDSSRDRSPQLVRDLHQKDPRICYLSFARNFGHQIAVTAGLNFVRGQVTAISY